MACKRSAVRSRLPPPKRPRQQEKNRIFADLDFKLAVFLSIVMTSMSPSSRGLGHLPFTEATGVRIPVGTPQKKKPLSFDSGFFVIQS